MARQQRYQGGVEEEDGEGGGVRRSCDDAAHCQCPQQRHRPAPRHTVFIHQRDVGNANLYNRGIFSYKHSLIYIYKSDMVLIIRFFVLFFGFSQHVLMGVTLQW